MFGLYTHHLVPTEGALEGARNAGTAGGRHRRCGAIAFGIGSGTPGPVGAVAVRRIRSPRTAAQAAWSRHASRASRDRTALHSLRPNADVFGQLPLAVGRRWTPRHGKRGRRLKGQPTGG